MMLTHRIGSGYCTMTGWYWLCSNTRFCN